MTTQKKQYILLDSAGIRKQNQRKLGAETFAVTRTMNAAWQSDVIILVFDASQPLSHQDQVVAGIAKETSKGVLVVANKCDLLTFEDKEKFIRDFYFKFNFLKVIDFIWVSAEEKINLDRIWQAIDEALEDREIVIPPEELRKLFNYLMKHKQPIKLRTEKRAVIYDLIFEKNKPPTFNLLVKNKKSVDKGYLKFLENIIRRQFKLNNTGIVIKMVEVDKKNVLT
jgi:GTPase